MQAKNSIWKFLSCIIYSIKDKIKSQWFVKPMKLKGPFKVYL